MAISDTPEEQARAAINSAEETVAAFIIEAANERARSQQAISLALDARITQAGFLQFAGAALAANIIASDHRATTSAVFALFSAIAFVAGGVACFRGVRSDPFHAGGLPPAWWAAIPQEGFKLQDAHSWAAGAIQHAVDKNAEEDAERARGLGLALKFAAAGAALVALSAALRIAG